MNRLAIELGVSYQGKPNVIVSEFGVAGCFEGPGSQASAEALQAQYYARSYWIALSTGYVSKMAMSPTWHDLNVDPLKTGCSYGFYSTMGLSRQDMSDKPSGRAVRDLKDQLAGLQVHASNQSDPNAGGSALGPWLTSWCNPAAGPYDNATATVIAWAPDPATAPKSVNLSGMGWDSVMTKTLGSAWTGPISASSIPIGAMPVVIRKF